MGHTLTIAQVGEKVNGTHTDHCTGGCPLPIALVGGWVSLTPGWLPNLILDIKECLLLNFLCTTHLLIGRYSADFSRGRPKIFNFEALSEDQKKYFEVREASLLRLEQVTERLINQNEKYRLKVDAERLKFRAPVEEEFRKKSEALDIRSSELDKREQEMDLADAKSARRKMRQDLLARLKPERVVDLRNSGTWQVHTIFVVSSAILLGLSAFIATRHGFDLLNWAHATKLGLLTVGLAGTLTLYYRWIDSWIRKSVDEELRLRQLSIDVDRSTWIIEVLSELKEETAVIPNEVLVVVTRNLFVGLDPMRGVKHPTEDVLRKLLATPETGE